MIYVRITGGLGNQLFEYAAARYLQKKKKDRELVLDVTEYSHNRLRRFSLRHFQIPACKKQDLDSGKVPVKNWHIRFFCRAIAFVNGKDTIEKRILTERVLKYPLQAMGIVKNSFSNDRYSRILLRQKNIYLSGYFQSEDFFPGLRNTLRKELQIKRKMTGERQAFLEQIKGSNAVCLHIRLGDYKTSKIHMVCTEGYYRRAVRMMRQKYPDARFFVFSDEVETVKKVCGSKADFQYEPEGCRDYETLELMKHCRHFIMSNSSLSWWAQYLCENREKTVIAPDIWFQDAAYQAEMYQKDWIRLQVR